MKLEIAKSWDFNQMLVASVFAHLLLMTVVIFFPPSTYEEIVITPAFVVELVDISKSPKKAVSKPVRKNRTQKKLIPEPVKPPAISQTSKMPPLPKANVAPPDPSVEMLKKLNQLNEKPSGVIQELDQLAKLIPKVTPPKPVVKKSQPIQEKTFDELNALKNKQVEFQPDFVEPLPVEDLVEPFENPKMQDLEFASLSRNNVEPEKKQDGKSAADLLNELTKIESKPSAIDDPPETQKQETPAPDTNRQEKSQAFDPILKKLEALSYNKPEDIKTEIASTKSFNQEFESNIRKVNVPKQVTVEVVASSKQANVLSLNPGDPGADVLAQYIGMIHEKVYSNWREPLAQKHDKEVVFSFYIYPKGNIDRPELKKGSNVQLLDNLALRAIVASEPFPPFPKEIDSSNLNISIHFKYIPEKGRHDS